MLARWFRAVVHSHNPQDRAWFAILPYVGEILVLENGQQGSILRDKKTPKLIPPGDADPQDDIRCWDTVLGKWTLVHAFQGSPVVSSE